MRQSNANQEQPDDRDLQPMLSNMPDNVGLDQFNHHGNMFENQPGPDELEDSMQKSREEIQPPMPLHQQNSNEIDAAQESFQNKTEDVVGDEVGEDED